MRKIGWPDRGLARESRTTSKKKDYGFYGSVPEMGKSPCGNECGRSRSEGILTMGKRKKRSWGKGGRL